MLRIASLQGVAHATFERSGHALDACPGVCIVGLQLQNGAEVFECVVAAWLGVATGRKGHLADAEQLRDLFFDRARVDLVRLDRRQLGVAGSPDQDADQRHDQYDRTGDDPAEVRSVAAMVLTVVMAIGSMLRSSS